ncbi:putative bifunctional diguanylate cyclase/phosphodiesterase [Cognaticolwellia mytili]|uniref:putative bifunctional diguanylate cyclase/phosphodiesterase n=1 Tax=Cognaticolwellia mytili TaxID=1888913 RepID=UPI000A177ABA|nr:bifunctional diguanylate cyclase/phosphodiesterase [Cognaticolwellia mytili]
MRHISLQSIGLGVLMAVFVPVSIIAYQIESSLFEQQIESSQQKTKGETEQAFNSFIQQQFRLVVVLAEEIIFLRNVNKLDYAMASNELMLALPKLQMSYPVSDIKLINPTQQTLNIGKPRGTNFNTMYEHLIKTESPVFNISCVSDCYMSVAIPVELEGIIWAFVITVELDETLVSFSLLRNINIALLTEGNSKNITGRQWQQYNMPILTNNKHTQPIMNMLASEPKAALLNGVHTMYKQSNHFVWQYQYNTRKNTGLNLLFIEDTTILRQEQRDRFIFEVIFIIVLLSAIIIAVVSFISSPVIRLRRLAYVVKKTGKKEYAKAIDILERNTKKSLFIDEISTVQNALLETTINLQSYEHDLKKYNSHLEHVASHDSITGLKNRYAFSTYFDQLSIGDESVEVTLILIDVFGLTALNNNLGHEVGDRVLLEIANKIKTFENDFRKVYRFGSDEFIFCCTNKKSENQVVMFVEDVLRLFDENIQFDKLSLAINMNVGIGYAETSDNNFHKLISQTAIALHEAKNNGSDSYQFFTPEMEAKSELLFRIKSDFSSSLEKGEFSLNYQPMINFWSEKLVKMEALIRWHHEEIGHIYPDQFIPILEETGQIVPLTNWILNQTLAMIKTLDSMGLNNVVISVNISGRQVTDLNFIDEISKKLAYYEVSSNRIELEITETTLVNDFDIAKEWVEKAQKFGFKVAMDDFGTGYSSLSYLTNMSFDTIKLDRSLIDSIATEEKHQNVVTSMVSMIKNLGLDIVVEGIENREQFIFMRDINSNTAQGYLISKPLSLENLKIKLKNYQKSGKWFENK